MNSKDYSEVIEISMTHAKEKNYSSYDVSDLLKSPFDKFSKYLPEGIFRKLSVLPFRLLSKKMPHIARYFIRDKYYKYPQGQAMLIRALVELA